MSKSHLHFLQVSEARSPNNFLRHIHLNELIHIPVTSTTTWTDVMQGLRERFKENVDVMEMIHETESAQEEGLLNEKVLTYQPESDVKLFAIFDIVPAQ